jgi:hypothetical protein
MSNRTATGITTIPLGTAGAGTVEGDGGKYIKGTGTNFLSLVEKTKASQSPTNYYIFIKTDNLLLKIVGVISDTLLLVDKDVAGTVTGRGYDILLADLKSWSVTNITATAGTVNGQEIVQGQTIESGDYVFGTDYRYAPPAWANGTSTKLTIVEQNRKA